ncbi:MAG: hypothetical protein ACP5OO_05215 [Chloroflexia bacterium]
MLEDFLARMGELRLEMERLAGQAQELERVVQEQQLRLEEMDLLVRQRDEQLAERQARVEELEERLRRRERELAEAQARLAEAEASCSRQREELEGLQALLAQREASEAALREELALREGPAAPEAAAFPVQTLLERLATLEELAHRQAAELAGLRSVFQEEVSRLSGRLERMEAGLRAAPPAEVPAPAVAVAPPPVELVADPLQALLQEALESLPEALCAGLSGLDGLNVALAVRREWAAGEVLEVELAELTAEAARVASALGTGPLLTLAFQTGTEQCLVSPVSEDHFAFLVTPAASTDDFRRAQAVLLQAASRLNELF